MPLVPLRHLGLQNVVEMPPVVHPVNSSVMAMAARRWLADSRARVRRCTRLSSSVVRTACAAKALTLGLQLLCAHGVHAIRRAKCQQQQLAAEPICRKFSVTMLDGTTPNTACSTAPRPPPA